MKFSADNKYLFSAGNDNFPFPGFEERNKNAEFAWFDWQKHRDNISDSSARKVLKFDTSLKEMALSPDMTSALLLDYDGIVHAVKISTRRSQKIELDNPAVGIAFTNSGSQLMLSEKGIITEYMDGEPGREWNSGISSRQMHLSTEGTIIGIQDKYQGTVHLFTFPDFDEITTINHGETEQRWFPDFDISEDNGQIWLAGGTWQSSLLNCHDAESGETTLTLNQFPYELNGLEEYNQAGTILSAHTSNNLSFLSLFNLEELKFDKLLFETSETFEAISKISDSNILLRQHSNNLLKLNLTTLKNTKILHDVYWQGYMETPEGVLLFRKQSDSNLYSQDSKNNRQNLLLELDKNDIVYYDSTGDWAVIVLYSKDQSAIVLNTITGKSKTFTKDFNSYISAFHPFEPIFYYYGENEELIAYDCRSGIKKRSTKFRDSGINQLGISPDGKILVSTNYNDTSILISDAETLKPVREIPLNRFKVDYINISSDNRWVYIGTNGDNIHIISIETGEVVDLYVYPEEWVLFTQDGYFTGSAGAGKLLAVIQGQNAFGMDQFASRYNRPDIIMERLGLKNEELLTYYRERFKRRILRMGLDESAIGADLHTPEVSIKEYEVEDRMVYIIATLTDNLYDLASYNIFINDVPLFGNHGKPVIGDSITINENFLLNPGRNKIEISVVNILGSESLRSSISLDYDSPVSRDLYFLGFGVSDYLNDDLDLSYAHKDAQDLETLFSSMNSDLYDQVFTRTYINEDVIPSVITDAKQFLLESGSEDTVVLFIAGHGVYSFEESPTYYYLTHNVDIDNLAASALNFEEIEELLQGIPARQKLFLMDTCESGEIDPNQRTEYITKAAGNGYSPRTIRGISVLKTIGIENPQQNIDITKALEDARNRTFLTNKDRYINNDLMRRSGAIVLSSCKGGEFSYEIDSIGNGFFTEAVLNAFKPDSGADTDNNYVVSADELIDFVTGFVSAISNGMQNPTVDRDNIYIKFGFPSVE
jgi:Caspase domain